MFQEATFFWILRIIDIMSRNEVKEQISQIVETFNDDKLLKALEILKSIEKKEETINFSSDIDRILEEDENLLHRLSQ